MRVTARSRKEPKGLRKISTFITADALLAAVLLVWAQLWARPSLELWSRYYQLGCGNVPSDLDRFNTSAGSGLVFTYAAVALALLALAWAGWRSFENSKKDAPTAPTALGLFSAALLFGILNVLQSMVSVGVKLFNGDWIYGTYAPLDVPSCFWWVGTISFILAAFIPVYAFHRKSKEEGNPTTGCWEFILGCKCLSRLSWDCCWKIEAVLVSVLAGFWLWSGRGGFGIKWTVVIGAILLVLLIYIVLGKKLKGFFKKKDIAKGSSTKKNDHPNFTGYDDPRL